MILRDLIVTAWLALGLVAQGKEALTSKIGFGKELSFREMALEADGIVRAR